MMEDGLEVQQLLAALDASIGELPLWLSIHHSDAPSRTVAP